jgi:hypothetical protein
MSRFGRRASTPLCARSRAKSADQSNLAGKGCIGCNFGRRNQLDSRIPWFSRNNGLGSYDLEWSYSSLRKVLMSRPQKETTPSGCLINLGRGIWIFNKNDYEVSLTWGEGVPFHRYYFFQMKLSRECWESSVVL